MGKLKSVPPELTYTIKPSHNRANPDNAKAVFQPSTAIDTTQNFNTNSPFAYSVPQYLYHYYPVSLLSHFHTKISFVCTTKLSVLLTPFRYSQFRSLTPLHKFSLLGSQVNTTFKYTTNCMLKAESQPQLQTHT